MKRSKSNEPKLAIRVLKIGSCSSLTGKSTLTYQIGCTAESDIQFRVASNTGGGFFSDEWVAFNTIQEAFDKQPKERPIISLILYPLFQGRSLNTPAFLLAVLKAEGLVKPLGDKKRGYERIDPAEFMAEIRKLINTTVDLKAEEGKQPSELASQPAKRGRKLKSTQENASALTN
ncbi:hypothetical protein [Nitrosomonas sp. Nm58]|uniref:hypothetical protein n=1 Tax=Nitrosomonas sp. Nm58 TaxID=200126 RepID=UPI000897A068|nr:hypothetical protein [Nitrosomonas sp. Nm58]SDZ16610.1 hypothetical protein SAMN05421754_108010 [Nitrosomonas sp. Nm58]